MLGLRLQRQHCRRKHCLKKDSCFQKAPNVSKNLIENSKLGQKLRKIAYPFAPLAVSYTVLSLYTVLSRALVVTRAMSPIVSGGPGAQVCELLRQAGVPVTQKVYAGIDHACCPEQMDDLVLFLRRLL